jgi:hypothetical protein
MLVTILISIFFIGYPLVIAQLLKKGRKTDVFSQTVSWFTGWWFLIGLVDMIMNPESYQFGPVVFLFSIPLSILAGAIVGFIVKTILSKVG